MSGRPETDEVVASAVGLTPELRRALPPFGAIRAFEAIGTYGGVRRAAEALSLDHAAISRQLRAMEDWAGVALVDRTPGSGRRLTPEGIVFYRRIAKALHEIAAASLELTFQEDAAQLRIWSSPGIASEWLTGNMGEFSEQNPDELTELQPSETPPDFSAHQAEIYLHYVSDHQRNPCDGPGLRSMEIARPPVLAVATPEFVRSHPPVRTPADLFKLPLLHETDVTQWQRWLKEHGVEFSETIAGPKLWQGHLTLAAARQSQGVALANALLVGKDLAENTLVKVGDWEPVYLGSYFFTARKERWNADVIRKTRSWLKRKISSEQWFDEAETPGDV